MKLVKVVKMTSVITIVALAYIHMQMQIIELAYLGKNKEQEIRKLIEENGDITYTVLTLKSANNLGINLLAENSEMQFVDSKDIITISRNEGEIVDDVFMQEEIMEDGNFISNIFSAPAEAKQE